MPSNIVLCPAVNPKLTDFQFIIEDKEKQKISIFDLLVPVIFLDIFTWIIT